MNLRRWLSHRRIGVLMGGRSAERAISLKTGMAIWRSLRRQGIDARVIDAQADLPQQLRRNGIRAAYIALHGPGGEDGTVQGLLEWLKIPYTGSGVLASSLAMDKLAAKRLFAASGLATAEWAAFSGSATAGDQRAIRRLGLPLVVKPTNQGSALGISIVKSWKDLPRALRAARHFGRSILVEKFIRGPEITVGLVGKQALPIIEIVPNARTFYDFHAKYAPGGSQHLLPARISARATRRAQELALSACRVLQTRAVARVDLIVGPGDNPFLLEVNTVPGMTETSLLPDAARAAGLDFDRLVWKIMESSFAPD